MQKYNMCYVLCKSCTKVLFIENTNWWYLYTKMRSSMCYLQKIRCYVICKMTISCYVQCKIKWPLLCAMCWKMDPAMCYVIPLEGPLSFNHQDIDTLHCNLVTSLNHAAGKYVAIDTPYIVLHIEYNEELGMS